MEPVLNARKGRSWPKPAEPQQLSFPFMDDRGTNQEAQTQEGTDGTTKARQRNR